MAQSHRWDYAEQLVKILCSFIKLRICKYCKYPGDDFMVKANAFDT